MSRQRTPYQWGTGSYAAGALAWSGTPQISLPLNNYFTPGATLPAQELNYAINQHGVSLSSIMAELGSSAAQNWRTALVPNVANFGTADNFQVAGFDQANSRWYAGTYTAAGTVLQLYTSEDGEGWSTMGNVMNTAGKLCSVVTGLVSGVFVAATFPGAPGVYLQKLDNLGTNTWVTTDSSSGASATDAELRTCNFGGSSPLYVALMSGAFIKTSPDGTTWTSRTVPAALAGITTGFSAAQSPTSMVAFARTANITSCMRTTNGTTWTAVSLGTLIGATDTVFGVAYGDSDGGNCYVACVQTSTGSKFLRSTDDGLTWSLAGSFGSYLVTDIAASGTQWVAVTELAATRASRTLYSVDAGTTWRRVPAGLSDNVVAGTANYTRPRVWATAPGFVQLNSKLLRISFAWGQTYTPLA